MFLSKINFGTCGRHLSLPFKLPLSLLMPLIFIGDLVPCSLSIHWTFRVPQAPGEVNDPGLSQPVHSISLPHSQGSEQAWDLNQFNQSESHTLCRTNWKPCEGNELTMEGRQSREAETRDGKKWSLGDTILKQPYLHLSLLMCFKFFSSCFCVDFLLATTKINDCNDFRWDANL